MFPMRWMISRLRDVRRHLAAEELRLAAAGPDSEPAVCLWRADPAVVIGQNQNPWLECDPAALAAEGVTLARRVSGGGAVYHDPGNLNLSVVLPRVRYRAETVYDVFLDALRRLGVAARRADRTSLTLEDGRKISGHAFALRGGGALHHGTLLLRADLDRLRRALRPALDPNAVRTAAIASRPMPVANLSALHSGLTDADVEAALYAAAVAQWGAAVPEDDEPPDAALDEALRRQASPDWLWGRTPAFTWRPEGTAADIAVAEGRVRAVRAAQPDRAPPPAWRAAAGDWFDPRRFAGLPRPAPGLAGAGAAAIMRARNPSA